MIGNLIAYIMTRCVWEGCLPTQVCMLAAMHSSQSEVLHGAHMHWDRHICESHLHMQHDLVLKVIWLVFESSFVQGPARMLLT